MKAAGFTSSLWRGATVVALALWFGGRAWAALPEEITITAPTRLELVRGDKVTGSIGLDAGERLALVDVVGDYAAVRYRNLNGRVLTAKTDLPRVEVAQPTAATMETTASAPVAAAAPAVVAAARPVAAHVPASTLERVLAGKLVGLENGTLRPFDGARLAGVKFYALYFSASWCPPCREFTPGFVDAYGKIRALYPEFEAVLVNYDHSPAEMLAYMRDDRMVWPALRWDAKSGTGEIMHYCGEGIPCLVLVDENGKVLSDTNRWGRYVGPDAVLEDTWKILRDYRRKNPRAKT
jgi:nucleoredoxin